MSFRVHEYIHVGTAQVSHSLWYKEADHDCCPAEGERVDLWEDGPSIEVRRRYFDHNLRPGADLLHIVVDPTDQPDKFCNPLTGEPNAWYRHNTSWFTERDGSLDDLLAKMEAGGWRRHGA